MGERDASGSWFGYCAEDELQAKTFFLDLNKEQTRNAAVFGCSWPCLYYGILAYYEITPTIYRLISAYTSSVVFLRCAVYAYERFYDSDSEEPRDGFLPVPHKQVSKEQPTRYSRWVCGIIIFGLLVWCEQELSLM